MQSYGLELTAPALKADNQEFLGACAANGMRERTHRNENDDVPSHPTARKLRRRRRYRHGGGVKPYCTCKGSGVTLDCRPRAINLSHVRARARIREHTNTRAHMHTHARAHTNTGPLSMRDEKEINLFSAVTMQSNWSAFAHLGGAISNVDFVMIMRVHFKTASSHAA
ncbi:hypothetical protein EVAR_71864_1 [Eumeta japonica]|uniref:Uncharacterized protein n=1 Tax=Eumeta variegata TaxID=151549 RepID=A0A4C1TBP2_EUMVA|nr:hypothetical protein EVAR_71864_1 [Eumeta japonica]